MLIHFFLSEFFKKILTGIQATHLCVCYMTRMKKAKSKLYNE